MYKSNKKEKPGEKRSGQVIYETFKPRKSIAYMASEIKKITGRKARFRLAKFITVSTRRTENAIHEDDV